MQKQLLVFTDLDGTLLDHHSYSYEAALPMINKLEALNIPVIPVTSKTRAELLQLRDELKNSHPFIVENGAAVFIPQGYFPEQPEGTEIIDDYWVYASSATREYWRELLADFQNKYPDQMTYFSVMGDEGVQKSTGLSAQNAKLANTREFSEPVMWLGDEDQKDAFKKELMYQGVWILEGGRFMHLSDGCDKGKALLWLADIYAKYQSDKEVHTIALGDSHNDVAMLDVCDEPIIIRSPTKHPPQLTRHETYVVSSACGPEGWDQTLTRVLARFGM
jgi:mannosyl-3-phosphoglycerate phosphatase family protein